jgi:non-lysosomal glucosylceramidase
MAKASGDPQFASECRRLFENGSKWIDANLFNGDYYIQKVRPIPAAGIALGLRGGMGADNPEKPEYQVGDGCLIDQLLGQYFAEICALGPLVSEANLDAALRSLRKYNHKPNLAFHDCVERTFALNDEAAMVICDYAKGQRPQVPFPYYAEVMTGFEHAAAALMIYRGMVDMGVARIADIRRRYDGIRRNPWDEAECGHHYARAMASWSSFLAISGFRYTGPEKHVVAAPRSPDSNFRSFWSAGTGWGTFELTAGQLTLTVMEGALAVRTVEFPSPRLLQSLTVSLDGRPLEHHTEAQGKNVIIRLAQDQKIEASGALTVKL